MNNSQQEDRKENMDAMNNSKQDRKENVCGRKLESREREHKPSRLKTQVS